MKEIKITKDVYAQIVFGKFPKLEKMCNNNAMVLTVAIDLLTKFVNYPFGLSDDDYNYWDDYVSSLLVQVLGKKVIKAI